VPIPLHSLHVNRFPVGDNNAAVVSDLCRNISSWEVLVWKTKSPRCVPSCVYDRWKGQGSRSSSKGPGCFPPNHAWTAVNVEGFNDSLLASILHILRELLHDPRYTASEKTPHSTRCSLKTSSGPTTSSLTIRNSLTAANMDRLEEARSRVGMYKISTLTILQ